MNSEESYRVQDLVGCSVVTVDGEMLGELRDVLPTGSNDVYVVGEGKNEVLIPALKNVVEKIDLAARRILVRLPHGLLDVYKTK